MLYLLGAMLLSMALQLDRHGLWNLLGPSLFALGILATAWVRLGGLGEGRSQQDLGTGTWVPAFQFTVGSDLVVITVLLTGPNSSLGRCRGSPPGLRGHLRAPGSGRVPGSFLSPPPLPPPDSA